MTGKIGVFNRRDADCTVKVRVNDMDNEARIFFLKAEATTDSAFLAKLWQIKSASELNWAKACKQGVLRGETATVYWLCPQFTKEQAIKCADYMLRTHGFVR